MRTFSIIVGGLLVAWLGGAWALMVNVGIAHDSWWHQLPVMGYSTALAICAVSGLVIFLSAFSGAVVKELL